MSETTFRQKSDIRNLGDEKNAELLVMVVEDDRTHRTLMDNILRECGFKTALAENGIVALSKIRGDQDFDLIIMDWDMPELNGLDTVREIRRREVKDDMPHIPVIAFTSNRNPGDREQCIAAGMDAYLPKDVWLPQWRSTLIDNLQGLVARDFCIRDFDAMRENNDDQTDPKLIDFQILEQSASLLKGEFAIAIDEYLEDAAAYIRDIKEGLENNDPLQVARGSHPLKSNSRSFGLMAVSDLAETINRSSREGQLEPIKSMLPLLQRAFQHAEDVLRKFVKRAGYQ